MINVVITSKRVTLNKSSSLRSLDLLMCQIGSKLLQVGLYILLSSILALSHTASAKERDTGRGTGPVVFVTSQGLYFDSIVVADPLPPKGRFQQLIPGTNGLETEYGPGTPGHLGGRWWIDLNEDGFMDDGDKYFLCPLLGPGRLTP